MTVFQESVEKEEQGNLEWDQHTLITSLQKVDENHYRKGFRAVHLWISKMQNRVDKETVGSP